MTSTYAKKYKPETEDYGIQSWPKTCMVDGCMTGRDGMDRHTVGETAVANMVVSDDSGREHSGPAGRYSQFIDGKIKMDPQYQFVRWITRCAWHSSEDTRRARGEPPISTTDQADLPRTKAERLDYLAVAKKMVFKEMPK